MPVLSETQKVLMRALISEGSFPIAKGRGLSQAGVYRCLERLEKLRVKNDGGTLRLIAEDDLPQDSSIARRCRLNSRLKAGAARFIIDQLMERQAKGESCGPIFLDCGSACAQVGSEIVARRAPECRVVTNNPLVVREFAAAPGLDRLWVLSGEVNWAKGSIHAPLEQLGHMDFDTAIIGTDLVSATAEIGLETPVGAELKQAVLNKSREIYFPVDQSKLRAHECAGAHLLSPPKECRKVVVVGVDSDCTADVRSLLTKIRESARQAGYEFYTVSPAGRVVDLA